MKLTGYEMETIIPVSYTHLYASVYGEIVEQNGRLTTTGAKRTGCMFCMFGVHLEKQPNRFQRMALTHPKQYAFCIHKLGCGAVLDFLGIPYCPGGDKMCIRDRSYSASSSASSSPFSSPKS